MNKPIIQQVPYFKTCQACGKSFEVKTRHNPKFCSNSCRSMFYKFNKLNSPAPDPAPKEKKVVPQRPEKTNKAEEAGKVYSFISRRECMRNLKEWKTKGYTVIASSKLGDLKTYKLKSKEKGVLMVEELPEGFFNVTVGQ